MPGVGETAGSFQGRSLKQATQMLFSPGSLKVPQNTQLRGAKKSIRLTIKWWHARQMMARRDFGLSVMKAC